MLMSSSSESKYAELSLGSSPFTQQDYYDPKYGSLLHSYCTGTYKEVVVLLL